MAHYRASLTTPKPPQEVFAYLAEFSNTSEWDPGVVRAVRIDAGGPGEPAIGSEFQLDFKVGRSTTTFIYRIVELESPRRVVLIGDTSTMVSNDRIEVEPSGTGSRVTYDATLTLKGPLALADPLLGLGFKRAADRALEGLRRVLSG